jgi:GNAT superfamily N-acetyltransferase
MTAVSDTLAPMRRNMRAFYRLLGERSPGGSVFERDGVLAAVTPSCPDRSVVNAVVYDDAAALAAALDDLTETYEHAGVRAWTVWVPEADRVAADLLAGAGHMLDGRPRAMTLRLDTAVLVSPVGLDWECGGDTAALSEINEAAYGAPPGVFTAATTAFAGADANVYCARVDGGAAAAACVVTVEHGSDCGAYLVATRPECQRRGLAGSLLSRALYDARERGCETSSLQATRAGYAVYRRLGYRDVCEISMWERRRRDSV